MARSNRKGTIVAFADTVVKHEGKVTSVSASGVSIETRAFGRQVTVDRFYPTANIVAASDEGHGFVYVKERAAVVAYYGMISLTKEGATVETETGRVVTFANSSNTSFEIHYDNDKGDLTSAEAKLGLSTSKKFATWERHNSNKAPKKPRKKKGFPKKTVASRTVKAGTRRA